MKRSRIIPVIILLAAVLLGVLTGPRLAQEGARLLYPRQYEDAVRREAAEFGLDESLVYAVIRAESSFDPDARSRAGAVGLMQLTEETYRWISSLYPPEAGGDRETPDVNIHCGCALLRLLLDQYGSEEVALCAYNAGMGVVSGWLADPRYSDDGRTLQTIPYPETRAYVKKVTDGRKRYEALY